LTLGELGDPRFERREGPFGAYLMPPLMKIPGGWYRIGSNEGHYTREAPEHKLQIFGASIGQFPVTNAEWAFFMAAGGYEDEQWWKTEAARAWRQGDLSVHEDIKQEWRDERRSIQSNLDKVQSWAKSGRITHQQQAEFLTLASWSEDEFEQWLAKKYPDVRQTQPHFWHDQLYNHPTQPVVGVCWYEAQAYLSWLSNQSGNFFRLPSEVEWEIAARGPEFRCHAFSKQFHIGCANTADTHLRRTSPVGIFPKGDTPDGVVDLAGNIYEWTSSLYRPYPYNPSDGREAHDEKGRRVMRGGAWIDTRASLRAAFRGHAPPADRLPFLGFRVSVSLLSS
jgi:formylglycine-generating enzyme required for sulfatase activity